MQQQCVFCRLPAEGNYSVNERPNSDKELPLCDSCGSGQAPLLQHIWHAIACGYFVTTFANEIVVGCNKCGELCKLVNPTTSVFWRCYKCRAAFTIAHFAEMAASVRDALTVARMRYELMLTQAQRSELAASAKQRPAKLERRNAPWRF